MRKMEKRNYDFLIERYSNLPLNVWHVYLHLYPIQPLISPHRNSLILQRDVNKFLRQVLHQLPNLYDVFDGKFNIIMGVCKVPWSERIDVNSESMRNMKCLCFKKKCCCLHATYLLSFERFDTHSDRLGENLSLFSHCH